MPQQTQKQGSKPQEKRVLLVLSGAEFTGAEQHVMTLAENLPALGWTPHILFLADGPSARRALAHGLAIDVIPVRSQFDIPGIMAVSKWLSAGGFTISHCHGARALLAAAPPGSKTAPVIVTFHEYTSMKQRSRWFSAMQNKIETRIANKYCSGFIAISESIKKDIVENRGLPAEATEKVFNGHDTSMILERAGERVPEPDDFFGEKKKNPGLLHVVAAARTVQLKGLDDLLEAATAVCARRDDIRFWWLGGPFHEEAARRAARMGLADKVKFTGPKPNPFPYIAAADMFLLPSRLEPFGLVLLEAMALGRPVIATRSGGPDEIVEHEKNGLLAAPRSPREFADAIERLASDPALRTRLGEAGPARAAEFSASAFAAGTAAVYEKTILRFSKSAKRH